MQDHSKVAMAPIVSPYSLLSSVFYSYGINFLIRIFILSCLWSADVVTQGKIISNVITTRLSKLL